MRPALLAAVACAAATALLGCRTRDTLITPDPHLNRMLVQEKKVAYQADVDLPHGMTMMQPPVGTMPADAFVGDPRIATGVEGDHWIARVPVRVDREQMQQGRRLFDRYCAACHGVAGDAVTIVADRMALRKPRNLLDAEVRGYPDGRIYQAIRQGYGLMPSYDVQLSVRDSWDVVAYVRALQLATGARAADLPADVRADLAKEAP